MKPTPVMMPVHSGYRKTTRKSVAPVWINDLSLAEVHEASSEGGAAAGARSAAGDDMDRPGWVGAGGRTAVRFWGRRRLQDLENWADRGDGGDR